MNHRDCGAAKIAYGADAVERPATETATHKAALMEFKKQVERNASPSSLSNSAMALGR